MPKVQIAGMEKRDARKADEEGNAFIRRAIGVNGDRAERLLIARRHANAAIGLRNVKAEDIGCVRSAQVIDGRRKVVVVVMADKDIQLTEAGEGLFGGEPALIRTGFACVKEHADIAQRYQKAASSQILHRDVFHRLMHSFPDADMRCPRAYLLPF